MEANFNRETFMPQIKRLSPTYSVAPQLEAGDFAILAQQGFKSVIANRPEGEQPGQLTNAECEALAKAAGLAYIHIPLVMPIVLSHQTAEATRSAIEQLPAPVLAFCRSGTRSAIAWASTMVATEPADTVIGALQSAGFQLPDVEEALRARKKT